MEINHHISFNNSINPQLLAALEKCSIRYDRIDLPGGRSFIVTFDILESDPLWKEIKGQVHGTLDIIQTTFSTEEILKAKWSRLVPVYQRGYPEPKDSWILESPNYKLLCKECGIFRQVFSYRVGNEAELAVKAFSSLHWTYDLFCRQAVANTLESNNISGFGLWDVIIHSTDQPSTELKQIYISGVANPGLAKKSVLNPSKCEICDTEKYKPHRRGYMVFSEEAFEGIEKDFILSYEWFGDGRAAYREIIVSNRMAKLILDRDWKGIQLRPVALQ